MPTAPPSKSKLTESAANVARRLIGIDPVRITRMRGGVMNDKYLVRAQRGERYVVRFYSDTNTPALYYEPDLVKRLYSCGLPVAHVLGDSRDGPDAPQAYMVYEMIPGRALKARLSHMDARARRRVAGQLADFLHSLQAAALTGHGDMVDGHTARYPSWHEFVQTSFAAGVDAAVRHRSLRPEIIRDIEAVQSRLDRFDGPDKIGVAWGDILTSNILVDDGDSLAGVVDFEGALAAEEALNLGYCQAAYGRAAVLCRDLRKGYGEIITSDSDRIDFYAVLRGVRVATYAHLPLPTGRKRRPVQLVFPGFGPAARDLAKRLAGPPSRQVRKG